MQDATLTDDYLAVGKIAKAHGIKGELKAIAYSGDLAELLAYQNFLVRGGAVCKVYKVTRSRPQGKFTIVQLSGVTNRDAAESLIGAELHVLKRELPVLAADEFYWHELVGLQVVTDQGVTLGRIESLLATGAHDVLVINGRGQEYLLPATRDIIVSIDQEAGTVVVRPLPGLLEMNQPE